MEKIIYFCLFILLMSFNPIKDSKYNSTYIIKDSLNTKFLLISDSIYIDSLALKLDGVSLVNSKLNTTAFSQVYELYNTNIASLGVRNNVDNSKFSFDVFYNENYNYQNIGYTNPSKKEVLGIKNTLDKGIEIYCKENDFTYKGNSIFTVYDTLGNVIIKLLPNGNIFMNLKSFNQTQSGCLYKDNKNFVKVK